MVPSTSVRHLQPLRGSIFLSDGAIAAAILARRMAIEMSDDEDDGGDDGEWDDGDDADWDD